jgi:hypothetical protein
MTTKAKPSYRIEMMTTSRNKVLKILTWALYSTGYVDECQPALTHVLTQTTDWGNKCLVWFGRSHLEIQAWSMNMLLPKQLWVVILVQAINVLHQEDFLCADVIFCHVKLYQKWGEGYVGLKGVRGKGWSQQLVGKGAVDSPQGTGVERSLHSCTKGHRPKERIVAFRNIIFKSLWLYEVRHVLQWFRARVPYLRPYPGTGFSRAMEHWKPSKGTLVSDTFEPFKGHLTGYFRILHRNTNRIFSIRVKRHLFAFVYVS